MQFAGAALKEARALAPCPPLILSLSLLPPLISSRRLLLLLGHLRFRNAAGASYSSHFHRAQTGICPMYRNSRENILSSDRWLLQRRRSDSGGTREYFALVFSLLRSVSFFSPLASFPRIIQAPVFVVIRNIRTRRISVRMCVYLAVKNAGRRSAVDNSSSRDRGRKNRERNAATSARINDGADGLSEFSTTPRATLLPSLSRSLFLFISLSLRVYFCIFKNIEK